MNEDDLLWTDAALGDLEAIGTYISVDSPAASERVIRRIVRQARSLADNPRRGRSSDRDDGTREVVVARTPYVIVYRLRERIEIIAIFHGARKWPERFA